MENGPIYPDDGGATLNESVFMSTNDLYSMALAYFDSAMVYVDEHQQKIIHSLVGRQYLYAGNYSASAQHAILGLQQGDDPFEAVPGEENLGQIGTGTRLVTIELAILASRFKHLLGEDFEDTNGNGTWDTSEVFIDCAVLGADVGQGDGSIMAPLSQRKSQGFSCQMQQ